MGYQFHPPIGIKFNGRTIEIISSSERSLAQSAKGIVFTYPSFQAAIRVIFYLVWLTIGIEANYAAVQLVHVIINTVGNRAIVVKINSLAMQMAIIISSDTIQLAGPVGIL